jgi:N-acetylglucosamine-6-phosphate deacetylase
MRYFDLQVNGYAGVDFNGDELAEDDLIQACHRLCSDGVEGILATIITDHLPSMCQRLSRLVEIRARHHEVAAVIQGLHIEGPFLNEQPGFIGAHPVAAACPAHPDAMQRLLDAGGGLVRIVTLAPERDPGLRVTRMLADRGICVAAGHCDPTLGQLRQAIDAGLSMFTHLGNGCPLMLHRHDNIIQRVLSLADRLWIGFIADGVHIPFPALANYVRCAGLERSFVVTDAIAAAGLGPGTFTLGGQQVVVDQQLATWAADRSHLVGSAGTMPRTARNLADVLGLSAADIDQLLYQNPRRVIGLD